MKFQVYYLSVIYHDWMFAYTHVYSRQIPSMLGRLRSTMTLVKRCWNMRLKGKLASLSISLSLALTHTHTHTHTYTHSLSLSLFLSLSLSLSHTHTHTHTFSLSLSVYGDDLVIKCMSTHVCVLG